MRKTNLKIKEERLRVSVRELVDYVLKHGSLKLRSVGQRRAIDGIHGHQIVQKRRGSDYRSEVRVHHLVEEHASGIVLELHGRIDGIYKEDDIVTVEEIKTTNQSLDTIELDENGLHVAQAKVYAFMFAHQFELSNVQIDLTYYQLRSSKTRTFRLSLSMEELTDTFNQIIDAYLDQIKELYEWHSIRDDSIEGLPFPFPEYRSGQNEFMKEVYASISDGVNLFAQAPTGLGKTLSLIHI